MLTDLLAASLSTFLMFGLGYIFAHQIQSGIREVQQWFTVALAAGLALWLGYRYYKGRQRAGLPVGPPVLYGDEPPLPRDDLEANPDAQDVDSLIDRRPLPPARSKHLHAPRVVPPPAPPPPAPGSPAAPAPAILHPRTGLARGSVPCTAGGGRDQPACSSRTAEPGPDRPGRRAPGVAGASAPLTAAEIVLTDPRVPDTFPPSWPASRLARTFTT